MYALFHELSYFCYHFLCNSFIRIHCFKCSISFSCTTSRISHMDVSPLEPPFHPPVPHPSRLFTGQELSSLYTTAPASYFTCSTCPHHPCVPLSFPTCPQSPFSTSALYPGLQIGLPFEPFSDSTCMEYIYGKIVNVCFSLLPYSAILLLGIYPEKTITQKDTCAQGSLLHSLQ